MPLKPAGRMKLLWDHPDCPYVDEHTPAPRGYIEWFEWAEEMSKTHVQVKCKGCKLYVIWVSKASLAPTS